MKANSNIRPSRIEVLRPSLAVQVRWNIIERVVTDEEDNETTVYDYEYNRNFRFTKLTKKNIMIAIIRETYDADDELELSYARAEDAEKLAAHEALVAFARSEAEGILAEIG